MFCSKCGNEVKDTEKFCGKCGNKISKNIKQKGKIPITKSIILGLIIFIVVLLIVTICFYISDISNDDVATSVQAESRNESTTQNNTASKSNRREELMKELEESIEGQGITWEKYSSDSYRKAAGGKSLSEMTNEEIEKEIESNEKRETQQKEYDNIFGEKIKELEKDVKAKILSNYFNSYNEIYVQKVWIALDKSKESIKYLYMYVSSSQNSNSSIIVRWDSESNELYKLNDYGSEAMKIWNSEDYIASINYENNDKKYTYMIRE